MSAGQWICGGLLVGWLTLVIVLVNRYAPRDPQRVHPDTAKAMRKAQDRVDRLAYKSRR